MSQEDYMRAVVGDDALWKPLPGFFTPGTPLYSENGGEILKGPRRLDAAKRLLADSGYSGQPVTCVVAQDLQITKAQGEVTADLLRKLGVNVDFAAVDWGTNAARRAQKSPRDRAAASDGKARQIAVSTLRVQQMENIAGGLPSSPPAPFNARAPSPRVSAMPSRCSRGSPGNAAAPA